MDLRHSELAMDAGISPDSPLPIPARAAARPPEKANLDHLPKIDLLGMQVHRITERQAIETILEELDAGRGGTVVTPNLDHLYRTRTDVSFSALVGESDLIVADGMPLVWASRLQGTALPERVAGSNMISTLSGAAAGKGRSLFLLGGAPGTADAAAEELRRKFPNIKIVGTHCPPLGFENSPKLMVEIVSMLTGANPDIVFVALGSPKQEYLIARLRKTLPRAWWLGVGVSFSFLCGNVRRAPLWMQNSGLEWVHRLVQEPRRLFKRYVVTGIPFAGGLLARSAYRGLKQRVGSENYAWPGEQPESTAAGDESDQAVAEIANPIEVKTPALIAAETPVRQRAPRKSAREGSALPRLKALVLLGGAVRPSPLGSAIGRSVLDLPMDDNGSILSHWLQHASQVAQQAGIGQLPVRVLVDRNSPEPLSGNSSHFGAFRVERDQSEYRGTGGVLKDLSKDYDDDAFILVANAAQILLDPLGAISRTLDQKRADIGLVSHRDGTPSGIMLIHVKALRAIPELGFVDMKEQAMPLIAAKHDIAVLHRRRPTGMPIRTRQDYILALRYHHSFRQNRATLTDPLAEDWKPSFSLVEPGALVDTTSRLHDSVMLNGAVVEPGAVLVRSVVCAGGIVRRDKTVIDQMITGSPMRQRASA